MITYLAGEFPKLYFYNLFLFCEMLHLHHLWWIILYWKLPSSSWKPWRNLEESWNEVGSRRCGDETKWIPYISLGRLDYLTLIKLFDWHQPAQKIANFCYPTISMIDLSKWNYTVRCTCHTTSLTANCLTIDYIKLSSKFHVV